MSVVAHNKVCVGSDGAVNEFIVIGVIRNQFPTDVNGGFLRAGQFEYRFGDIISKHVAPEKRVKYFHLFI